MSRGTDISVIWFFLVCSTTALVGCTVPPTSPSPNPNANTKISRGSISATASRFLDPELSEPFEQFEFLSAFPSCLKRDEPALDLLINTHVPELDVPIDNCIKPEPIIRRQSSVARTENARISLLDVGDIYLTQGKKRTGIPTRTFPDLLQVVDGVMYSAARRDGVEFLPRETYSVRTTGTDQVAPFEVVLDAPDDLGDVRVNGISPSEQTPLLQAGKPSVLTWEGEGWGDEVIVRLTWSSVGLSWVLQCRMRDDGQFVIPGRLTRGMGREPAADDYEMTLSRVRQVSYLARGLHSGDFNFVVSTNFLVQFDASK